MKKLLTILMLSIFITPLYGEFMLLGTNESPLDKVFYLTDSKAKVAICHVRVLNVKQIFSRGVTCSEDPHSHPKTKYAFGYYSSARPGKERGTYWMLSNKEIFSCKYGLERNDFIEGNYQCPFWMRELAYLTLSGVI